MDSSSCDQPPSPKSLISLACEVKYPHGNYLIHQLVLNNLKRKRSCSESDIRAALRSFPGAWVNASNEDGFTPLHLAVMKRSSFMVKMLLSSCMATIDVNAKCGYNKGTALHLAASEDYFDSILSNAKKTYLKTELGKDLKGECLEIVKVLLASDAFINTKDNCGQYPLHVAAQGNQIDVIKLLISNGVDITKNVDLNSVDNCGWTPLHTAVANGRLETVNILVKNGALLNFQNKRGRTPLHVAAEERQVDVVKVLISHGAEPNIKDKLGITPLVAAMRMFSFEKGNREAGLETVKLLVESGADINEKPYYYGSTPFHFAVKAKLRGVIEYLISKNVDLNCVDKSGMTPLHSAVGLYRLEIVKDLVRNGALLNAKNDRGETPLHIAAKWNFIDIMKVLISSGADVNAENPHGRTPLHEAMDHRNLMNWDECFQAVEILVESGADVKAVDKGGKTALSIAEARNYSDIIDLLKEARRVAANAVVDSGDETYFPVAASSNTTVSGQPPFKKRRTSET